MKKLLERLSKVNRNIYMLSLFFILFTLLGIRLYIIQVHPSQIVQGELQNYQNENISLLKYNVLDVNGKDMINYEKKYVMVLDTKPFALNNYEETIEDLMALNFIMQSENIEFSYSDVLANEGKNYFEISEETYKKVNLLTDIKGIYTYTYDVPNYSKAWEPENFLSNIDYKNIVGGSIQQQIYNYTKDNTYPILSFYLDDKAVYSEGELDVNEENKNIKLTINKDLQDDIRNILLQDKYDYLKDIGVILLESNTGNIRAMVQKDETQANINIGIGTSGYEPGSIFKIITEAVALEEGLIQPGSKFYCDGSVCLRSGKNYAHGTLSVYDAFNVSCNNIFGKVGEEVGYNKLMEYCDKLGIFSRVLNYRAEGKDEAIGIKPKESDGLTNISIGQCSTVTPIQMAGAINTVINDGVYVKPNIIDSIVNSNDDVIEKIKIEEKVVFSETTSRLVQQNMRSAIKNGTGKDAYVEDVEIGGKTGSSTGVNNSTHGWFAGYCNIDGIKYTIVVLVPNLPEKGPNGELLGGGNTAGSIFADIVKLLKE